MKLPVPFIQLPLRYDAQALAAEILALGDAPWRDHPQKFPGNSMLPLIAVGGDPADESFSGPMAPTDVLRHCPYLQQVLASFGTVLGRTRLMRLDQESEVSPHVDVDYYWAERVRIHVPILTQPGVRFVCADQTIHMAAGECWIFDTWRRHMVYNAAPQQRIHLVADTVGAAEFWSLVERGHPHDATPAGWQPRLVPPAAGVEPPHLRLEQRNVPAVMTPWEMQHHLLGYMADLAEPQRPEVRLMHQACHRLLQAWRGLWAEHGDGGEGHDAYRAALQAFLDALPEVATQHRLVNGASWFHAVSAVVLRRAVAT